MLQILRTPPKTRGLVFATWTVIMAAPLVNFVHFSVRGMRGDYPPDADSIAIPIFTHALFLFPFELFALRGLQGYRGGVSLFTWSKHRPFKATMSTIGTCYPFGLWCAAMIVDGVQGEIYGTTIFYAFRLYAFLLLRCGLMCRYDRIS